MQAIQSTLRALLVPCLGLGLLAGGASAADVYVVHGIDGTDLGLPEALPVDVEVNGACALDDVVFGAATGRIPFDTGTSSVTIRLSDGTAGTCTGTIVLDTTINVAAFETAVVVAGLDINGTITLSKFTVDTAPLAAGEARLAVAHAAAAPRVDVQVRGSSGTKGRARLEEIANGGQSAAVDVPEGTFDVVVRPSSGKGVVARFADLPVAGNVLVVAVGTLENGTFGTVIVPIA